LLHFYRHAVLDARHGSEAAVRVVADGRAAFRADKRLHVLQDFQRASAGRFCLARGGVEVREVDEE
jgi:hypothetical protein